jgi:hypothetical protein
VVASLRQYTRDIGKNLGTSVELTVAEEQRWERRKKRIDSSKPKSGRQRLCWTGTAWSTSVGRLRALSNVQQPTIWS